MLHIGVDPTEVSAKAGLGESLESLAELVTLPVVSLLLFTHCLFKTNDSSM